MYDVIIIGGGCAGLPAAIFATRRELKTLVIAKDLGGQISMTNKVCNYPGLDGIDGLELVTKMKDQAAKYGSEFVFDTATKVDKSPNGFTVQTHQKTYEAKTVILAFGKTPRNLDVPGEKEYSGKGVVYCATCDGPLFKDKTIAIVGGGNSAFTALEYMSKLAKKIYLVHRREEFKAEEVLVEKAKKDPKIEFVLDSAVQKILGNKFVEKIEIRNLKDNRVSGLEVQGVFVEIGFEVNADFVKDLIELDNYKQIVTSIKGETKTPGLFAAGDVTNYPYKQAVISAGAGAAVGLAAFDYLSAKESKKTKTLDWGKH